MPYFKFDGHNVYYQTEGSGKPLLLIHGNSVSSVMFNSEIEYYSKYFKVIIYDYPGHGKSGRVKRFRDDFWRYNAEAGLKLLEHLDIHKTFVIGTSGGALTGLNMAVMQPKKIKALIADSFLGNELSISEAEAIIKKRRAAKSDFMTLKYWQTMNGDTWENVVDNDLDLMLRIAKNNLPLIYGDLSDIKCPVLCVASSEDKLIPNIFDRIERLCSKLPDCRKAFYNYGRHTFMITEKEDFRELALEFLSSP